MILKQILISFNDQLNNYNKCLYVSILGTLHLIDQVLGFVVVVVPLALEAEIFFNVGE